MIFFLIVGQNSVEIFSVFNELFQFEENIKELFKQAEETAFLVIRKKNDRYII